MKKLLIILLSIMVCTLSMGIIACSGGGAAGGDEPLAPPKDKVETDLLVFTYKAAAKGYSVKGTELAKSATTIEIPNKVDGYDVTQIEDYAFTRATALTSINIPTAVATIGTSAFYGCSSLTSITIPDATKTLKTSAFEGCSSLATVKLPDEMRLWNNDVFSGCSSLKEIKIPSGLKAIPNNAFSGCGLLKVTIPETVTNIKPSAFSNNSKLAEVNLPKGLISIGDNAFYNCVSLTEILFPSAQELTINDYAFAFCGLKKVYLPSNVTLGTYVFQKLCWDEETSKSSCEGIYYESPEGDRGINAFGYTWDNPASGFRIYVPTGSLAYYQTENPGDESWTRCVVNVATPVLAEYDIATTFPDGFPCIK